MFFLIACGQCEACCTPSNPCSEWEGDCQDDEDCAGDLKCGKDKCLFGSNLSLRSKCCYSHPPKWQNDLYKDLHFKCKPGHYLSYTKSYYHKGGDRQTLHACSPGKDTLFSCSSIHLTLGRSCNNILSLDQYAEQL